MDIIFLLSMHIILYGEHSLKKSTVDKLRFCEDLFVAEDSYFFVQAILGIDEVVDIKEALYCYVRHEASSTSHSSYNEKNSQK